MRMPERIPAELLAPCGMDCMVCYKHLAPNRPCAGCRAGDAGKPEHCRACAVRDCAAERGAAYCACCGAFPCKRIKNLERTYRKRYGVSLIANGEQARDRGAEDLLAAERARWTCSRCGGAVSLHDGTCSECGGTGC